MMRGGASPFSLLNGLANVLCGLFHGQPLCRMRIGFRGSPGHGAGV
jgi:hypothetical protein